MATMTLTAAATAAAQFLGVLDSGESLSAQQLTDALNAANNMLENWTNEQVRTIQAIVPIFSLAGGTYTPGTILAFPDTTTPLAIPLGYFRAIQLGLAIELAPQYDMQPSPALLKNFAEARSAANPLIAKIALVAPYEAAIGPQQAA